MFSNCENSDTRNRKTTKRRLIHLWHMGYYLQAILIPIIASPFAYLLGKRVGSKAAWFVFAVLLYSTIALILSAQTNPTDETYIFFPAES